MKPVKNTSRVVMWIIIGVVIFLILMFLLLRRWFWGPAFNGNDYIPDFPENNYTDYQYPPVDTGQQTSSREFDKSNKLTTISFSRSASINDGDSEEYKSTDMELQIVLTGYLREVPTSLSNEPVDYVRDYVFDEGSVEWNIYLKEVDADPECVYTYTISEQGSDNPSNLGDTSVHEAYRIVKVTFSGQTGQPDYSQLSVDGNLMLNLDELNEVEVYDPSQNIHAICDGHEDSTTFTEIRNVKFEFPLVIKKVDITKKEFTGSFVFDESSGEEPLIDASVDSYVMELPYTITEIEPVLWDVEWEINLP